MHRTRPRRARSLAGTLAGLTLASALGAAVIVSGLSGAAHAQDEDGVADISVTVPAKPSETPSAPPSHTPRPPSPKPTPTPTGKDPRPSPGGTGTGTGGQGGGTGDAGGGYADWAPVQGPAAVDPPNVDSGGGVDDSDTTTDEVCVPTEPPVPDAPAVGADEAEVDRKVVLPGGEVIVSVGGFTASEDVQVVLFADEPVVGAVTAAADGNVEAAVPISDDLAAGPRTVQLTGWCGETATAQVVIGSESAEPDSWVFPAWAWWIIGALALAGVAIAIWRMRVVFANSDRSATA